VIPGNHETNWSESGGRKFLQLWQNDRFLFSKNGYLFVGFNTGPYMKMGDGHVKEEDLQWLKRELERVQPHRQTLIAMAHYPLAEGLDNWFEVTKILKKYNCRLAFCGHGHQLKLFNFDGIPGIMGRSVLLRGNSEPGYNIIGLHNDSALIFEKKLAAGMQQPQFALDLKSPQAISNLEISLKPDSSVNAQFPGVEVLFSLQDTASIFTGPCISDDSILIYGNSLGFVKAINFKTHQELWRHRVKGSLYSTPVSTGEVVAMGTIEGDILGLDVHTGEEVWRVKTESPVLAEGIIENNEFFIGGGDQGFFAIDMSTGNVLWRFNDIDGTVQGKPAIHNDFIVFGAWDRYLYCLNKKSGHLVWKWNNGSSQKLFSPGNIVPVIANDKVFIVAPDRYMTALDLKTGQLIWRTNKHMVRESMGISPDGGQIYAKLMNDSVVSVNAAGSGFRTLWALDAGNGYDHNPCPVAADTQRVLIANKNGVITALSPKGYSVLWRHKFGNSSVNKLVIDGAGNVWASLIEGKIVYFKN
jgi:outer membrane protein assembly factor BamB